MVTPSRSDLDSFHASLRLCSTRGSYIHIYIIYLYNARYIVSKYVLFKFIPRLNGYRVAIADHEAAAYIHREESVIYTEDICIMFVWVMSVIFSPTAGAMLPSQSY